MDELLKRNLKTKIDEPSPSQKAIKRSEQFSILNKQFMTYLQCCYDANKNSDFSPILSDYLEYSSKILYEIDAKAPTDTNAFNIIVTTLPELAQPFAPFQTPLFASASASQQPEHYTLSEPSKPLSSSFFQPLYATPEAEIMSKSANLFSTQINTPSMFNPSPLDRPFSVFPKLDHFVVSTSVSSDNTEIEAQKPVQSEAFSFSVYPTSSTFQLKDVSTHQIPLNPSVSYGDSQKSQFFEFAVPQTSTLTNIFGSSGFPRLGILTQSPAFSTTTSGSQLESGQSSVPLSFAPGSSLPNPFSSDKLGFSSLLSTNAPNPFFANPFASPAPTLLTPSRLSHTPVSTMPTFPSLASANENYGDEEDEPPVFEPSELGLEPSALCSVRAKLFFLNDGKYSEIGVGIFNVKPAESDPDSFQLVFRLESSRAGGILMNIKVKKGGQNMKVLKESYLVITSTPNPPLTEVLVNQTLKENPKTVCYLVRTKITSDLNHVLSILKIA